MVSTCDTLILSDLHLGSEVSRAQDAMTLLESVDFRQLILLGDIFSDLNFRRLTGEHWEFLSCIRRLSNPKRRRTVVWVEGNHDQGLSNVMSHLVGIPVYQRYVWEYAGKRHLAIHGHQFDRFINRNVFLSRCFEAFYHGLQRVDTKTQRMSRWLDRLSTSWLRLSDEVAQGAIEYAREGRSDRVFCGHTHVARSEVSDDGVEYFNSGSWMDQRATFLTIDLRGVHVHEYSSSDYEQMAVPAVQAGRESVTRAHGRHSRKERGKAVATVVDVLEPAGLPALDGYESLRC